MSVFGIEITSYTKANAPMGIIETIGMDATFPALDEEAFNALLAKTSLFESLKSRKMNHWISSYVSAISTESRLRWAIQRKLRAPLNPLKDRRGEIECCDYCGSTLGLRR